MRKYTATASTRAASALIHQGSASRKRPLRMVFTTEACVPTFMYSSSKGFTPISVVEVPVQPRMQKEPSSSSCSVARDWARFL